MRCQVAILEPWQQAGLSQSRVRNSAAGVASACALQSFCAYVMNWRLHLNMYVSSEIYGKAYGNTKDTYAHIPIFLFLFITD